ncbi:hypothetical protein ACTFIZ_001329 [Dictyostelium cf. discoideum]
MNKNFLFTLFLVFVNLVFVTSQRVNISVDYNINKGYVNSQCGVGIEPSCTSLEDAGNRAILESVQNNATPIYFYILSNINGSTPASLGNLYSVCGVVQILSPNVTTQFTIDGSNTNQPFLTIEEPSEQTSPTCLIQRRVSISNLKFTNWKQTLIKIHINQETQQTPADQSKSIGLQIFRTEVSYSSSIILIYPKNLNENYNYNSITVNAMFTAKYLTSLPELVAPNSIDDLLPPLYIVGATVQDQVNIENSNISLTPFFYVENCFWRGSVRTISKNTFSCNPFMFFVKSEMFISGLLSFFDNEIMTYIYFSEQQADFLASSQVADFTNISTPTYCHKNKYLNYQYYNSFTVFIKGNSTFSDYYFNTLGDDKIDTNFLYAQDGNLNFVFSATFQPNSGYTSLFNIINSTLRIYNIDMSIYQFPIVGSNSSVYIDSYYLNNTLIFKNETFCNCSDCLFYEYFNFNIKIIDTSFRYSLCNPKPTPTPSTTTIITSASTTITDPTTSTTTTTSIPTTTTTTATTGITTTAAATTTTGATTTTTTSIPTTSTTSVTTSDTTTSPIQTGSHSYSTSSAEEISMAEPISKRTSIMVLFIVAIVYIFI